MVAADKFLTNHAAVLACIAHDPSVRLGDVVSASWRVSGRALRGDARQSDPSWRPEFTTRRVVRCCQAADIPLLAQLEPIAWRDAGDADSLAHALIR
jgi:hypothetical protein